MIDNRQHLQDSTEFFALGLSMLEQTGKTNLIPELMQLLTPKQVIMLTQVYGGKTLRIPSPKELAITLKAVCFSLFIKMRLLLGWRIKLITML